jgi:hypothetical protein
MVESGLGNQFLTKNFNWTKDIVTDCWTKSLWEFVSKYGITIRRADQMYYRQLRHHKDQFLIEIAMERGADVIKAERITFNLCRLYLQVELVSDITTADGVTIRKDTWNGIRGFPGKGWWPKQPRPSERAWNIWRRLLQQFLHADNRGRLFVPFPKTHPTDDWQWLFHEESTSLYERSDNGWMVYSPILRVVRSKRFS